MSHKSKSFIPNLDKVWYLICTLGFQDIHLHVVFTKLTIFKIFSEINSLMLIKSAFRRKEEGLFFLNLGQIQAYYYE